MFVLLKLFITLQTLKKFKKKIKRDKQKEIKEGF